MAKIAKYCQKIRQEDVFWPFRRFGGLTEISAELFRPILTEISAEISVSVVHYWQHWQLITYRHQSTGSLTKSISLDSEFAGVTCSTIDVTVRAVIHSGRIQMTIAHWASKATFMPILKEMGQLISVASFFRRQIKFWWKLGLKSVPAPEIFLLKITVDIAIVYKVGNTDFFLWRHMWRIFMTPFFRQFILIFIENDAIYFTSPLFVLVSYATYIWAHNHRYLLGSGDRTRVGRVSCFKIKLPCPAALTDLQNWVQLWS